MAIFPVSIFTGRLYFAYLPDLNEKLNQSSTKTTNREIYNDKSGLTVRAFLLGPKKSFDGLEFREVSIASLVTVPLTSMQAIASE